MGVLASRLKHTLPDLPYDYGALEPHICAEIMQLHHSKHHATYVNNLNVAEEKYQEALAKGEFKFILIWGFDNVDSVTQKNDYGIDCVVRGRKHFCIGYFN